jgi:hypothetical protein
MSDCPEAPDVEVVVPSQSTVSVKIAAPVHVARIVRARGAAIE